MGQTVSFVNPAYHEAIELLQESHTYISYRQTVDESRLSPKARLKMSYETMRLTARLTQVMAWMMLQRAAQNSEIEAVDTVFEPSIQVGTNILELAEANDDDHTLPVGLRNLLERSHGLYIRVKRIEDQLRAHQS